MLQGFLVFGKRHKNNIHKNDNTIHRDHDNKYFQLTAAFEKLTYTEAGNKLHFEAEIIKH